MLRQVLARLRLYLLQLIHRRLKRLMNLVHATQQLIRRIRSVTLRTLLAIQFRTQRLKIYILPTQILPQLPYLNRQLIYRLQHRPTLCPRLQLLLRTRHLRSLRLPVKKTPRLRIQSVRPKVHLRVPLLNHRLIRLRRLRQIRSILLTRRRLHRIRLLTRRRHLPAQRGNLLLTTILRCQTRSPYPPLRSLYLLKRRHARILSPNVLPLRPTAQKRIHHPIILSLRPYAHQIAQNLLLLRRRLRRVPKMTPLQFYQLVKLVQLLNHRIRKRLIPLQLIL